MSRVSLIRPLQRRRYRCWNHLCCMHAFFAISIFLPCLGLTLDDVDRRRLRSYRSLNYNICQPEYSVVSFCTRCCFRWWFTTISSISAINYRWFIYLTFKGRRSLKILISCKYWCKAQNTQISSDRNRLSLSLPPEKSRGGWGFMENMCKMKETDKKSVYDWPWCMYLLYSFFIAFALSSVSKNQM